MLQITFRKTAFFLLSGLISLSSFIFFEEDFTVFISRKLLEYRQQRPPEKAFLHLDKPYYTSGDTLWFASYLVEGSVHQSDSTSNVLYVDLIAQKTGKSAALRRVQMDAGIGHGEIVLADSIAPGAYTVRAYTNWMRNFPEEYFFQKEIYVFGFEPTSPPTPVSDKIDLQFFPEGGRLLAGVGTRVAFKAINAAGLGQDVAGFILDQKKDTVASFRSDHLGMGRFPFEPKAEGQYQAFLKKKDGPPIEIKFPEIQKTGYSLIVDNLSSNTKMRIIAYAKLPDKKEVSVHIVGHSRGVVAFVAKGKITERGLMTTIPTTGLPDGITHITLFDDIQKPVCERLIFLDHGRSLKVEIAPSKVAFARREKTEVEITVTDSAGKPVEAHLSLAATDANQIQQQPDDQNITSYLLLSSDIKGFVEKPGYYFDLKNSARKIHLDYLMMTQGWSRFRWDDVLQDSIPMPKYYVEQGITLEGEVRRNKRPADKIAVSIFLDSDSLSNFTAAESDPNGRFSVYNLVFPDSLTVRLQGMNKKGNQSLSFSLLPFVAPKVTLVKTPFYPVTVDAQRLAEYLRHSAQDQEIARKIRESRERLLKEVTIKAKKEVPRDSRKIYGTADASIKVTPELAAGRMSILDILAGRVAGVQVVGSGMNASVFIRGSRNEPQFVLDGMPVEKDFITTLNVYDVESIDVIKGAGAAIFGSRGGNGVISILTKRGNPDYDYSKDIVPGVLVSKISGFNTPKEFYAPAYTPNGTQNEIPDYRSTVFWAPSIKTDKNGKARLQFYNSDASGRVDIQVHALQPQGFTGFAKATYSVN